MRITPFAAAFVALALLACDGALDGPEYEELTVTGTATLNGAPQAVRVVLFSLGGATVALQLDETTSDAQGRYELSVQVEPELCPDFQFFVAADFGPVGGSSASGEALTGCGEHVSDVQG